MEISRTKGSLTIVNDHCVVSRATSDCLKLAGRPIGLEGKLPAPASSATIVHSISMLLP